MTQIAWRQAEWLNPPAEAAERDGHLVAVSADSTDFWRTTSYGFVHDDGHALLAPFPNGSAVEVTFAADFREQFDQAGLMVRVSPEVWVKAGIEYCDGLPQLGAVVTRGLSDWSQGPAPEDWIGREITVRASRSGDALTVRARCEDGPWRMIRLAPLDPDAEATAGPVFCSPSRAGFEVRFTRFVSGPADESLH
jgi:regulation of enolase protein 1 (concanavalin A-like superfamily)